MRSSWLLKRTCSALSTFKFYSQAVKQSLIMTAPMEDRVLMLNNLNPHVIAMEYAVRGPLVIRALEIEKEIEAGIPKPFKTVIKANIGDAHAMGQKPISFLRQVVSCAANPELLESGEYPWDVVERVKRLLNGCGGHSVGSYSQTPGIEVIRKDIADYITRRDGGIPSNINNIQLSGGASESIRNILKLFVNDTSGKKTGVMVPIPQYPLYSASVEEFGLGQVGYYLDESNNWALNINELERAYQESLDKYNTRVLCVINPGNPTGQVLTRKNIEDIIRFAYKYKLFLMADEVYQDNIYDEESKFYSLKSVMTFMGEPFSKMELASFHSVSKGYVGECGLRGGYVEVINMHPTVLAHFKKMTSAKLCSSILGQIAMDCVVNPPKPGEPSYVRWIEEKTAILKSLKERAKLVKEAYDSIDGIHCNPVMGAMYAFPRIDMPPKAIAKAQSVNQHPDFYYAMQLLENKGVCVVPGSGFGQKDGTYHFRTTILPQPDLMRDMLTRFEGFHKNFMKEFS